MSATLKLLRITALVSIVTSVTNVALWGIAPKSNNTTTLIKRLTQTVNRTVGGNFGNSPKKVAKCNKKFHTNSEDDKITQTMLATNDKQYNDYFNPNFQPQNVFKCPPCVCKNISSNSVSVLCNFCSITKIPQSWPVEIDEIIMEDCKNLKVLDLRTLLVYTSLTRVEIMTYELFKVFSSSSLNVSSSMIDLDLQSNCISTVEENCFVIFPNLLKLSLRNNRITIVTKEMFTGLSSLRYLSVAANIINFIANNTFDDMGNLVTLDISENRIIYTEYDLLPVGIFISLRNLEQLYINDMCERGTYLCGTYPNKALQVLTNLKLLSIDGADKRGLGPEIKSLVHLRHLIMTQPKSHDASDESYFDNAQTITTLKFQFFKQNIPPKAFSKLRNLVNLTFKSFFGNEDLCKFLKDMEYFQNSSLNYLTLSNVNDLYTGCQELNAQQGVYLKLLKLIELDLSGNNLVFLSPDFLAILPETLKKIDLSRNRLSNKIFVGSVTFPKELLEINLNYQFMDYNEHQNDEDISQRRKAKNNLLSEKSQHSTLNLTEYSLDDQIGEQIEVSKYSLKPKLQILRADYYNKFGDIIWRLLETKYNYSLKTLSLAGNDFKYWGLGMNFLTSIEIADFSNNNAQLFNTYLFPKNNSLKYFFMSNNVLGHFLQFDRENLFFANLKQLIVLNISRNSITEIANDYFRNLVKLQILDISDNKLQMINISFSHITELTFLDLRSNSITSISKQSRDDLDLIAADHRVCLDLTSNPLPCTCDGLEIMKWMAFTNAYLLNQDFLVCRNEFNQVHEIGNIVQRVETLQRQCASKTVIILTCVFSIIVFGILLITSLMYRYRWKLRYLRRIGLVKLLGARPAANNMIGYRFDAYILYTDDTRRFVLRDCVRELEEKRGHRLCIEERDFLPGTYIVTNIVSGVQNSAKTVAMVTPEFYEGEFSEYCIKMSLMEEIFLRRSVLFLCVCEPTDDEDLSHDLLTVMKQNKYIEYPPRNDAWDEIIDEFWNQFSQAIGRNEREEI